MDFQVYQQEFGAQFQLTFKITDVLLQISPYIFEMWIGSNVYIWGKI